MKVSKEVVYAGVSEAFEQGLVPLATTIDQARANYDKMCSVIEKVLLKKEELDTKRK